MKLYIITNQTRTSVTQAVCTLEELTAADHASIHRDLMATLAYRAAFELERKSIPNHIRQLEDSALLAFPVGGAQ